MNIKTSTSKKKLSLLALMSSISFFNFAEPINAMMGDGQENLGQIEYPNHVFKEMSECTEIVEHIASFLDGADLTNLSLTNKMNAHIAFKERFPNKVCNLYIPRKRDRNSNQEQGATIFSVFSFLKNSNFIKHHVKCINLNLFKIMLNGDSASRMVKQFESIDMNVSITKLNIARTGAFGYLISAVSEQPEIFNNLKKLNVSSNFIIDSSRIVQIIDKMKSLKKLDASGNPFQDKHIVAIAETIKRNNSIEELKIGNNVLFGDEGIEALADALNVNKSLKKLDFSGLSSATPEAIVSLLDNSNNLQELIITHFINKDDFLNQVIPAFMGSSLKTLVFKEASFNENELIGISQELAASNPKKTLNLSTNEQAFSEDLKNQINNNGVNIIVNFESQNQINNNGVNIIN